MPDQPVDENVRAWHRRFAVEANNLAWRLSEKTELAADEKTELLYAAYAAAHHWSKIGTEQHIARAELLLGRIHALLGYGDLAMKFATAAFDSIVSRNSERWELAFAHAILADAAAASGDSQLHAKHYTEAKLAGESLVDTEDRDIFLATFRLIPPPPIIPETT
jgi:hypothetical protein